MTVVSRNFQDRPTLPRRDLRHLVETAIRRLGPSADSVAFVYLDDAGIARYHRRYLGRSGPTDVISFPGSGAGSRGRDDDREPSGAGDGGRHGGARGEAPPAVEEGLGASGHLGDVLIGTDEAQRHARRLGHSYLTELSVLALHGLLHLCGYDHTRDRGEMRALEERLRPRVIPGLSTHR